MASAPPPQSKPSLYDTLGGAPAVKAAVEVFYAKVLADPRIARFFDDIDMDRQKNKQRAFLTMVLGGPAQYGGKRMREGHRHLVERGLNDDHVDAVLEQLAGTLRELGVRERHVAQVVLLADSLRDEVLDRVPA